MIIQPTIVDPISPNPIDALAYGLYKSLGLFRWLTLTPFNPNMGLNCGGFVDRSGKFVDHDWFCVEQWHKGWIVFTNIFIWTVVIIVVILVLRRKFLPKPKSKTK